jgi:hypothetical protein
MAHPQLFRALFGEGNDTDSCKHAFAFEVRQERGIKALDRFGDFCE